jgi:hypothetical protein
MKYLQSKRVFENLELDRSEIKETILDILLPISDMGYEIDIFNGYELSIFSGLVIKVVSFGDPSLKMDDEVKDEFIRLNDYLESIGKSIVVYYVQLNWFNKVRVDFDKFIEMNDCEFLNLQFIVKC